MLPCPHLSSIIITEPTYARPYVCQECVKTGDTWVHLRLCMTCGATLCCDSSPNTHATAHFHQRGHPIMRSIEPGEQWRWCYVDQRVVG